MSYSFILQVFCSLSGSAVANPSARQQLDRYADPLRRQCDDRREREREVLSMLVFRSRPQWLIYVNEMYIIVSNPAECTRDKYSLVEFIKSRAFGARPFSSGKKLFCRGGWLSLLLKRDQQARMMTTKCRIAGSTCTSEIYFSISQFIKPLNQQMTNSLRGQVVVAFWLGEALTGLNPG